MCDQIEAELETYAFTGDVQPRVFMDFHSRRCENGKIEVSPYPFDTEEILYRLPIMNLMCVKNIGVKYLRL